MRFCSAIFLSVSLAFSLSLSAQTTANASGQASVPAGHANGQMPQEMHLPKPTNLQVLPKDISSHDLMTLMFAYGKALGVECTFCHAQNPQTHRPDFASDAKPDKEIARTMMRMTQDINSKYLSTVKDPDATPAERTVTCGTCHRGKTMPAPFLPAAGPQHQQHEMPMKPE